MVFDVSPVLDWSESMGQEGSPPLPPPLCLRPTRAPNAGNMSPFLMPLVPESSGRDCYHGIQFELEEWEETVTHTLSSELNRDELAAIPSLAPSFTEHSGAEILLGTALRMQGNCAMYGTSSSSAGMSSEITSDAERPDESP